MSAGRHDGSWNAEWLRRRKQRWRFFRRRIFSASTELNFWFPTYASSDGEYTDEEFWEETLAPFEEENNCTVNVEIVPWDSYEEKYLTGVNSNDGPDVGYLYMEMFYDYIDMEPSWISESISAKMRSPIISTGIWVISREDSMRCRWLSETASADCQHGHPELRRESRKYPAHGRS